MNNDTTTIQKLPEQLTRVGNQYQLFKRGNQTLVYAEVNSEGKHLAYEVFQIKIQKAGEMFGKWYPARERFPGSEAFGKWAWSYSTMEAAQVKFEELERAKDQ